MCNLHTVSGAQRVSVSSASLSGKPARIIRIYPQYDLALLKIPGNAGLRPVPLAATSRLALHQQVYHIGRSYLLNGTLSEGRITGLGTSKSEKRAGNRDLDIIRLNIRLFQGESGGPLFNQSGRLIGMIVAKDTRQDGVSYAVPVNKVKKILSDL